MIDTTWSGVEIKIISSRSLKYYGGNNIGSITTIEGNVNDRGGIFMGRLDTHINSYVQLDKTIDTVIAHNRPEF